ncbi:MAG TPA: hypothetical protein VKB11_05440, partial [Acidimicrobiia bacterium]|nr:hypothetical protein [Acidimicrobiia bacterium]
MNRWRSIARAALGVAALLRDEVDEPLGHDDDVANFGVLEQLRDALVGTGSCLVLSVAGARRVVGDASDSPAPSRYQMNPAASATTSSATIPTRGSPRNPRTRSTKRSKGPPQSLGR